MIHFGKIKPNNNNVLIILVCTQNYLLKHQINILFRRPCKRFDFNLLIAVTWEISNPFAAKTQNELLRVVAISSCDLIFVSSTRLSFHLSRVCTLQPRTIACPQWWSTVMRSQQNGGRMHGLKITIITPQTKIFSYGRSIFVSPNISVFFDTLGVCSPWSTEYRF